MLKTFILASLTGFSSYYVVRAIFHAVQSAKDPKTVPYPKDVLGGRSAKSAVTGGHPEEMNEMPPDILPHN